jgi:hypothetical protein
MSAMHLSGVHTERRDIVSSWILAWLHNHTKYLMKKKLLQVEKFTATPKKLK